MVPQESTAAVPTGLSWSPELHLEKDRRKEGPKNKERQTCSHTPHCDNSLPPPDSGQWELPGQSPEGWVWGEQGWVRPRRALRAAQSKQLQQNKHGSFTARHEVDYLTLGHGSWKPVFKYPVDCTSDHEDTGYLPYLVAGEVN